MKWIDWNYLKGLASPLKELVDVVYDRCQEMDLVDIMSFSCPWNEEIVAQFYATLHISECGRIFQFLIGEKRFTYTMAQFSILFGHTGNQVGYVVGILWIVMNPMWICMKVMNLTPPRCTSC